MVVLHPRKSGGTKTQLADLHANVTDYNASFWPTDGRSGRK